MNNSLSIISSLIIFLFPYIGRKWCSRQLLSSTVISLGLLGTFGGIMYGLWIFGVDKIDESLPQLLEGIKIAFLTSIAGLTSSLILKLCPSFYGIRETASSKESDTETQLLELLKDIRNNTSTSSNTELLNEIRQTKFNNPQTSGIQINSEALAEAVTSLNTKISEQVNQTLTSINALLNKQLESLNASEETNKNLNGYLQETLAKMQATNNNIELFLSKSSSLNFRQNESLNTELVEFGNLVKTTEQHFQTQLNQIEEKYAQDFSEMEKLAKTLTLIIQKLTQDHESLYKNHGSHN